MPFLHCVYQRVEISRSARFFSPAALLFSFLFSFFPFLFFFRRSLQTFHLLSFSFSFSILQLFSSRFVLSRLNGKEAMAIWRSRENETSGEGDIDTVPRLYRQYLGAYTTNTPGPRKDIWRPLLEARQLLTHPKFCLFPPRLSVRQSRGQQTLLPFTNDPPNSVCLFSLFILIVSFLLHFFLPSFRSCHWACYWTWRSRESIARKRARKKNRGVRRHDDNMAASNLFQTLWVRANSFLIVDKKKRVFQFRCWRFQTFFFSFFLLLLLTSKSGTELRCVKFCWISLLFLLFFVPSDNWTCFCIYREKAVVTWNWSIHAGSCAFFSVRKEHDCKHGDSISTTIFRVTL